MKLDVFVSDKPVAALESPDGFEHVLTYRPEVPEQEFVSLLMPVRIKSYVYPELHPIFQMNLPEGFLLSVLQEQLGPHVGASPLNLLAVVGRNMIGRIKVAAQGADPTRPPLPFDVRGFLKGDNKEEAFLELVRRYATSGVSGVVPKFLSPEARDQFFKAALPTPRYIVKGSSQRLPFVALNEHLCMMVAAATGFPTATTEVSDDGQALLVHRFDVDRAGVPVCGMEDLCSLLGLRPAQKYESTWERVTKRVKEFVPNEQQASELETLAGILLLTYALGNADCHTKNVALTYTTFRDVKVSPIYDMLTTSVYEDYINNPPALSFQGRKTWRPGKALQIFVQTQMNVAPRRYKELVARIGEAIVETTPELLMHAKANQGFRELGKRMLHRWNEGLQSLRTDKSVAVPDLMPQAVAAGFSDPAPVKAPKKERIGRSPLFGRRGNI